MAMEYERMMAPDQKGLLPGPVTDHFNHASCAALLYAEGVLTDCGSMGIDRICKVLARICKVQIVNIYATLV